MRATISVSLHSLGPVQSHRTSRCHRPAFSCIPHPSLFSPILAPVHPHRCRAQKCHAPVSQRSVSLVFDQFTQ
jgi:hypothetical protein